MEEKCLQSIEIVNRDILKSVYRNSPMESSRNDNIDIINKNTIFKDDDSGSGSSEDVIGNHIDTESNEIKLLNINREHENVAIYLETPVIDENNICLSSHDYEKAKPKRLSDEFLSSDDNDDETTTEPLLSSVEQTSNCNQLHSSAGVSFFPIPAKGVIKFGDEEDTNSTCSNLESALIDESSQPVTAAQTKVDQKKATNAATASTSSSDAALPFFDNDVQSMDAIERRDFEHEQRLTGGIIIKSSKMANSDIKFKLGLMKKAQEENGGRVVSSDSKCTYKAIDNSTTPTSSRNCASRLTKSTAKMNLSSCYSNKDENTNSTEIVEPSAEQNKIAQPCSSSSLGESSKSKAHEIFSNANSNDSLSSEKSSCSTSSNHSLSNGYNKPGCSNDVVDSGNIRKNLDSLNNIKTEDKKTNPVVTDCPQAEQVPASASSSSSSSSSLARCQYPSSSSSSTTYHCEGTFRESELPRFSLENKMIVSKLKKFIRSNKTAEEENDGGAPFKVEPEELYNNQDAIVDAEALQNNEVVAVGYFEQAEEVGLENEPNDNEFDEETWADCEDGSDEEVCTCHNDHAVTANRSLREDSFDDLPSKDVDLSSYIHMVSISEDIFLQENVMSPDTTGMQRKRKLNESGRAADGDSPFGECSSGRKRMALDCASTPRSSHSALMASPSTPFGRRTPRSLIPTRDNPPPELQEWLLQFQKWSHVERLLAVDRLIDHCEPTQVRHMMKVIEPQFQRDFISLLPRELALQVLSYLDPTDLLRAAQTCRSWRFLCDDNLLWKEKCRKAQILTEPKTDKPKRGRAGNMPPIASPWKAAYMRQHIIELNWRSRPIRDPKVLKGHDDHVITCLQFCGNRIVSGSDDNTLKVWSAVTGRCLRTLVGHTGGVWSSQMSGNTIISGSTDRTLKVWDLESGQCVHTLLGHTSTVRCMHLHGKKVVSGSRDATLRVWDIESGSCLHVLVGHLAAVRCVQYDGKLIVSGAYDYMVKIWHPERQECLHTLQGHTNRVYSLQFDGIHVVSGSLDTSIRVWDVETGNCKHTLMGHQSLTSGMELRQNILVSGNADSTVKVWDITSGQCLQTLSGPNKHQSAVTCLQFNSRFVITSSDDGTVKLWDVKTGEFIRNLVALDSGGSGGVVWRIRANDTKLICAVGSRNGTEETKLMVLDFDVEGACVKCS